MNAPARITQIKPVAPKVITLAALAREEMKRVDGNVAEARAALMKRLRSKDLLAVIVDRAISDAVSEAIGLAKRSERVAVILGRTKRGMKPGNIRVKGVGAAYQRMLLDLPLASGRRLRDATGLEVRENADRYLVQGSTMLHTGRWLARIHQLVPADSVVGDVLTEDRAKELYDEERPS